jgi:hypothetical protein
MNADPPKSGRCVRRSWLRFATCGLLVAVLVVAAFFAGRVSMLPRAEEAECQLEILRDPDAAAEKAKEALVELMRENKPFTYFMSPDQIAETPLRKAGFCRYYAGPIFIDLQERTYGAFVGDSFYKSDYRGRFDIKSGQWKAVETEHIHMRLARPKDDSNEATKNTEEAPSAILPERAGH